MDFRHNPCPSSPFFSLFLPSSPFFTHLRPSGQLSQVSRPRVGAPDAALQRCPSAALLPTRLAREGIRQVKVVALDREPTLNDQRWVFVTLIPLVSQRRPARGALVPRGRSASEAAPRSVGGDCQRASGAAPAPAVPAAGGAVAQGHDRLQHCGAAAPAAGGQRTVLGGVGGGRWHGHDSGCQEDASQGLDRRRLLHNYRATVYSSRHIYTSL